MTNSIRKRMHEIIATFFYVGYAPWAPGTCGSLATIPLLLCLRNHWVCMWVMVVLFVIGRYSSNIVSHEAGDEDPKYVVIDEVVGMLLSLFLIENDSQSENKFY